ncbi:DUF3606 domain-containing protein [Variovorax paradoxus]|nr:DUF3606 domain-containing protein [Variovorax paradoxus]
MKAPEQSGYTSGKRASGQAGKRASEHFTLNYFAVGCDASACETSRNHTRPRHVEHVLHQPWHRAGMVASIGGETFVSNQPGDPAMPDDMEIRVPQNDERIDITDLKEVDYWTKWFGVSEARLRMAVASAGTIKDDLRIYLGLP